ncbi:MAG: hypothetical protein K9J37_13660 [Saprospiraceae bacterium]|nr:hypothetical protein [Saprospiraceae bacterium]MCF8250956.1 hypothetical protein [Saprospiraceae bacterium]MCF8281933.1 hypothetical protein [Bacteroidales bacterium]MCF8311920.1 hypothetical protein [Saprospiraceae bacterium]MCF8441928.1 hypothetical protein [Saprospiraceae bacterium]
MKPNILVFDCEAVHLHGVTFAAAALVIDRSTRQILDQFELLAEEGIPMCGDWVQENVLPHLGDLPTCKTSKELRDRFFQFYQQHKGTADIFSDVNFPVETNFLSAIVADDPEKRQFEMPYPLYDVANFVDVNIERFAACGIPNLRKHHPLDDALASGICYLKTISGEKLSGV